MITIKIYKIMFKKLQLVDEGIILLDDLDYFLKYWKNTDGEFIFKVEDVRTTWYFISNFEIKMINEYEIKKII